MLILKRFFPYFLIISLILINLIIFFGLIKVFFNGDTTIIAGVIAFIGAIIGGVITFAGVNLSIKDSNGKLEQQVILETARSRLTNLYYPLCHLLNEVQHKHGAHYYDDLDALEKMELTRILSENIIYGDHVLNEKYMEFRWALVENSDIDIIRGLYDDIGVVAFDELHELRKILKLPNISYID